MANSATQAHHARPLVNANVQTQVRTRMLAIDALRGLVMLFMLIDHVRETFFLHAQVSDPMDPLNTPPELFFTRISSMVCAPVFIFLTGLSAWLYGQSHSRKEVSTYLLKRGVFQPCPGRARQYKPRNNLAFSLLSIGGPSTTWILATVPKVICAPCGVNIGSSRNVPNESRHSRP